MAEESKNEKYAMQREVERLSKELNDEREKVAQLTRTLEVFRR
jgi:predicted RNase H-like nuclease (RuvC/YqgF family)